MLSWAALAAITVFLLWVDLHFFARGREPSFREGVVWSIGWLVVAMVAGLSLLVLDTHGLDDFVTYTTVYFVERSLSLDNLFVFVLLFAYFGVPTEYRARLLFYGIAAALVLRGGGDPGRRRAAGGAALLHLRAGRAAAHPRLPDPARGGGERRPRPQLHRAAGAAGVPGDRRLRGQAAVRAPRGHATS